MQRNTFETHCSRKSPHWKKDRSFREFKKFYKKLIQPTIDRATELTIEMTKLSEETEVNCSLDLDRLNDEMSRLNSKIKKVEDERTWDSVHLIRKAAEEVKSATRQIKHTKARRGKMHIMYNACVATSKRVTVTGGGETILEIISAFVKPFPL